MALSGAASLPARLAEQAQQCSKLGSPLYAELLLGAAADVAAGGPTAAVLAPYVDDPAGSALALRLMAALHRQVLRGQAPQLAAHYPSVGGTAGVRGAWADARALLLEQPEQISTDVGLSCQTNEPGRSVALLAGLLHVTRSYPDRPVRLLEFGASAGLNLLVDRYRIGDFGPRAADPLVRVPWEGRPPAPAQLTITARGGCDRAPLDPGTAEGRLALTASVWADQVERFHRLTVALRAAADGGVRVEQATASVWIARRLAEPAAGTATVVWHSVVWQYLDGEERRSVSATLDAAGAAAQEDSPLVLLSFEPELRGRRDIAFALRATRWPGGVREHLADGQGHGPPVRLRQR
jgi:hypothetical protein